MDNRKLHIALLGEGFVNWGGGLEFLRSCVNGLVMVCDQRETSIKILLPDLDRMLYLTTIRSFLGAYKRVIKALMNGKTPNYYRHKPFSKSQLINSFKNIDEKIDIYFYAQSESLSDLITKMNTDVIIPSFNSLGNSFPVPWVGYIYDFQHKYFQDYFSSDEIKSRNNSFEKMLSATKAVIVNSISVKDDIKKFFPDIKCNVFNLPFSATPLKSWFEPSEKNLVMKYNLPEKYFIICNQFWLHKDHLTAFKAFANFIQKTGQNNMYLVCTGSTHDFRDSRYFIDLERKAAKLEVLDKIRFLGYIPKKDQIDIMKNAVAVIQPTLFEGGPGGGAVYDAIAIGVPAILSDIPINKEIKDEDNLFYFKVGDYLDLAHKMEIVVNLIFERPNPIYLMEKGKRRIEKFGHTLLKAIYSVV
jgi:glycosyltransferase involved in cell wall biosynthesis